MKKIISAFLVLVMVLSLIPMGAFTLTANAATSGGYTYSVSGGKATITDYTGSATSLTIPSTLDGYIVTSIGFSAFYCCDNLTSITIPDSVTSIGYEAFYFCTSLTSITMPNGVTSIGQRVFSACTSLTSITMPNGVTSIGYEAFCGCDSLTSITIPDSVISIGSSAFSDCDSLTSITIPDSVISIGSSAFSDCDSLTSITVDENNPNYCSVDGVLFSKDKTDLCIYPGGRTSSSYTIPDSVTSIGDSAFKGCNSLTSITIPDSVISIGSSAFSDCDRLISITIPDSVTSIGSGAFRDCSRLVSITIPDSVTSIGDGAFFGTSYYNSGANMYNNVLYINNHLIKARTTLDGAFTIKAGTKTIAGGAFSDCTSLTSVTIPDSVTSIGDSAFSDCTSLTSITIPDSVTSIGSSAFYFCDSLENVFITDVVTWCNITFGDYAANPLDYADQLYINGELATDVVIPDGVTKIPDNGFSCENLTSVTIGNSVTSIGSRAFFGCTNLTSITIGNSVTSIGDSAFRNCTSLTSITMPNGVTSIGYEAFCGCDSLTSITIPDSVKSIGNSAFYNTVYYNNAANWENDVLYIGNHLIEAKEHLSGTYAIKNGTKTIANSAFYSCTSLTSITIPDSVTSIGDSAFSGCRSLTSITIPDSVTSIGQRVFSGCTSLTSITIPDSVTSIGSSAFWGCSSLSSVTIPDSVKSIENSAFRDCSNLTSITIPDSVTSIGDRAFSSCDSLTGVCYTGDESDRLVMLIGSFNEDLTAATWYYNACKGEHTYSADCDAICNACGYTRGTASALHSYTNECDTSCDFCDANRNIIHNFGSGNDAECRICGFKRLTSSFLFQLDEPFEYTGLAFEPKPMVVYEDVLLTENKDYTLSYRDNVNAGRSTMVVNGINDYSGITVERHFTIKPLDIQASTVSVDNCQYTGKPLSPSVTVKYDGKRLVKDKDYAVQYRDNTGVGTASVVIIGIGNYMGCIIENFEITADVKTITYKYGSVPSNIKMTSGVLYIKGDGLFSYSLINSLGQSVKSYISRTPGGISVDFDGVADGTYTLRYTVYGYKSQLQLVNGMYQYVHLPVGTGTSRYTNITYTDSTKETSPESFTALPPIEINYRSIYLPISVLPIYASTDSIKWYSSDPTVAQVDGGIVTFYKSGNVTIRAKLNDVVAWEMTLEPLDISVKGSIANFDPISGKVTVTYDRYILSPGSLSEDGDYTVETTSYGNAVVVKVTGQGLFGGVLTGVFCADTGEPYNVNGLSLAKEPNKIEYIYKEGELDLTGGLITVDLDGENVCTVDINKEMVSGFNVNELGEQTLTVTYGGKTTTFKVMVICEHHYNNACDSHCNICGDVREVGDHDYADATCTAPKICLVCGDTAGEALGHDYADATCTAPKTCKECGVTSRSKLGHKYTNACDTKCNRCNKTRTITHSYKTTTTKATTSKNGSIVKKCSACSKVASTTTIKYAKTFSLSTTSYTYNGGVKTPTVTVKDSAGKTLKKNTDYTVSYASGRKTVGTYKVTIKMKGNYSGTKTLSFKIKPANTSKCTFKLSTTTYTYNGKVKTPSVTVKNANGTKLTRGTHYTVTYASGRKNVGTYKVTIKGKGNYTGTKTLTFKINPAKLSSCKLSTTAYSYNGKVKTPTVSVKNASGTTLTKNTHYTVTYASGRKNVGTYKVTIKGKGNYTDTKTLTFKINPAKTTVSKVTSPKAKTLKITVGKKTTQTTGYQIQYSTSKSFKSVKNVYLSNKTTAKTITGLKAKTTYYVRVRTYKTVGGVKYYSGWSTAKSAKTK